MKYHNNFAHNWKFNLTKLNQTIPKENIEIEDLNKYLLEVKDVLPFIKALNINLEGEIDFIILSVKKDDITNALSNESKKYYVFGDKSLFQNEIYEIFGEVTINLFSSSVYIKKFKQLVDKYPNYFKTMNINQKKLL